MRIAVGAALVLWALVFFFPGGCLGLLTDDAAVVAEGTKYLQIIAFSYVFFAMTNILLAALRKLLADGLLKPEDRICYLGSQRKEQRTSFMEMNIVRNLFENDGEETYQN